MRKQNHPRTDESEHARAQNEERKQRGQQAEEPSEGGTREKNERTQKQHAEEDYNSYGEGDYQMSDSDGYRTPTAHAVEEQVHDTVPARPKNAETVSDNIGADKEAIPDKEDIPVKRHEPGGNNEGLEARQKSLSPKRQLSDNWKTNGDSERGKTSKAQKTCSIGNEGRQEQTTGSEPDEGGPSRPKQPIQQYMHSFVTFSTHDTRDAGRKKTQQGEQADTKRLEEDGFLMTGIKGGDDMGRPLQHWLDIVGGKITDVAANGHCGRLAFLAALHNVTTGLSPLHTDVVEAANNIKKQVMNNMIANVADEFKVHPAEMESALAAAGKTIINKDSAEEKFCALANHYADQRNKSVKSSVPMNYWVRPDHIKAMAMHAREMVFVLDVVHEDNVRLQVYGYQDWGLTDNTATETGVVSTMPSHIGTDILRELTAAGTLPLIMVLHYSKAGNHYQAVTYEPKRYEVYTDKWKELTSQRNRVLTKYEGRALDAEPYDSDKLAKAATKELKALRRAAKVGKPRQRNKKKADQVHRSKSQPQLPQIKTTGKGV
ncbi:hypothetical protein PInf_022172 [Phytophthora infestans]|nr:hypothetical protein PInf_022172 [Phytophthora infestans]